MRRVVRVVAAVVLGWPVVGYPWLLRRLARRRLVRRRLARRLARLVVVARTGALPTITIVVPTSREAANIEGRLADVAASDYPPELLDVVVVDSGSDDGTAEMAERWADTSAFPVKVLREPERRGKAAAINTGLSVANGELIVLTDAPTRFAPGALRAVAAAFEDPEVGAATGWFEVTGEGDELQQVEQEFWKLRNRLRALEGEADSTPFLSGELCALRRGLVDALDEDTLADDMNVALRVRRAGHRVVVVPEATYYERRSGRSRELLETKGRRAAGGMQELLRFRAMAFDRRYGVFGTVILPSAALYYVPLRVPALLLLVPRRWWPAAAVLGLASRRARMALFNELVLLAGWRRLLHKQMDVRWVQEGKAKA